MATENDNLKRTVQKEEVPGRECVVSIESEIAALKTDLTSLIGQFAASRSMRFTEFALLWQEMRMPELILVATAQRADRELRKVIEESLAHSMKLFHASTDESKRYGSLYLLYSLYSVQPTIPKIKIRITLEMWENLRQLLDRAVEEEEWDIVYTGGNLVSSNAFHFVAAAWPFFPEKPDERQKLAAKHGRAGAVQLKPEQQQDVMQQRGVSNLLHRLSTNTAEIELAQSSYIQSKQALGPLRLPGMERADAGVSNDILSKIRRLSEIL